MAMNTDVQRRFMYLFERVGEPLYFGPRGAQNTYYNVPIDSLPSKTQHAANEFRKNMASTGTAISVKSPRRVPNLSGIGAVCPKNGVFSYFLRTHRNAAEELKRILMAETSQEDFLSMACTCRDSEMVNPRLWIYAFASTCLSRPDMKGFRMPAFYEVVPDQFVSPTVTRMAQRQAILPEADRAVIIVDRNFTGDDSNPENRLAYFREDLGINSHHWHWHLIYPVNSPAGRRDRKGELFYYMHHSMLARYEAERLCHNLSRVRRLELNTNEEIPEGYFPKLYNTNSGVIWGTRQEGTRLQSVDRAADARASFTVEMEDLMRWGSRISEAIDTGVVMGTNNTAIPLTLERGIDILGDIIEAADITPNMRLYGDFHNMGHVVIAASHDPKFRHRENLGVMGDTTTAMRDPIFYRWHKYIDEIFDKYKSTIPPYTSDELVWQGIQVTGITVQTPNREANILATNWMQSDIDLSRGMDFGRTNLNNLGAVWARMTHLNHENFMYKINVTNSGRGAVSGTVRIFLAPRNNERGTRFDMNQQRTLFFELDKFTVNLRPGANVIDRASSDSSVTVPWEQTFRDLERMVESPMASQAICGCGWPQHMLLPRGQTNGMLFDLYVIVTDGAKDQVARRNRQSEAGRQNCRDSVSFCGLLDELYPDAKAMGFPFDRFPGLVNNRPMSNLDAFVQAVPNSRTSQIRIVHRDVTILRAGGAPPNMETMAPTTSRPSSPTSRPSSPTQQKTPAGISSQQQPQRPQQQRPSSPQSGRGRSPSPHSHNQNWWSSGQSWGGQNQSQGSGQAGWHSQQQQGHGSRSPSPTGWTNVSPPRQSGWGG